MCRRNFVEVGRYYTNCCLTKVYMEEHASTCTKSLEVYIEATEMAGGGEGPGQGEREMYFSPYSLLYYFDFLFLPRIYIIYP